MKKPFIGLLSLSALCASGVTGLAWAGAPYQQPPAAKVYDAGGADIGDSIGVDSSLAAVAVTSDAGNGVVMIYPAVGAEIAIPFDPGNLHPTNQQLGIPMTVVSKGLSAVAVDPQTQSVYAAGETFNGTNYECLIKKYDATGGQVWSITHNFQANTHGFCNDVAVDGSGNVVVGGTRVSATSYAYAVTLAKFDANGNFLAGNGTGPENCGPATPCHSQVKSISIGSDGRVVALADNWLASDWIGVWDANLQKMPGGNILTPPQEDVAVDANGNIYAVGWATALHNGTSHWHHLLVRYDSSLNEVCRDLQVFGYTSISSDWYDGWYGVTIGSNGNAYAAGSDQKDVIAMEYDATCTPQWTDALGAVAPILYGGSNFELGYDIAVDASGDLHITGTVGAYAGNWDALTLKYTHN